MNGHRSNWLLISLLAAAVAVAAPLKAAPGSNDSQVTFHFAGYADATFTDTQGEAGSLGEVTFAPIFHIQVGERFLFEAEAEFEADDRGGKAAGLEYATASWLLNDSSALVVGKFLSPVGYFFQNLHPSWINKLASVPAGFGHGGAAPLTDVGVQLRGGHAFSGGHRLNYALYFANGPRLGLEGMEGLDLDVEGSSTNRDGERVWGGRVGWMPSPRLELGASLTRGDVVLDPGEMGAGMAEPARTYNVEGLDVAWQASLAVTLRGEWIRQRVGDAAMSVAPEGGTWRAWYAQGAYRFGADRWETVLRVGDSQSPHSESTFQQTALGLNYLIRPGTQLKLSWERNDSDSAEADADRVLLQLAHGF
ncbi:MAG: hypothetical protein A3E01_18610 [Gammaproteobacteria bacterium RIFCSPHIGHO2_12_FULL_63_22]|nr:MAG: hypothetical protein A3E01_18610 [Gammaproteobacteria bacterium RIFCSPHIGHO2_12_FULL_63_22]